MKYNKENCFPGDICLKIRTQGISEAKSASKVWVEVFRSKICWSVKGTVIFYIKTALIDFALKYFRL